MYRIRNFVPYRTSPFDQTKLLFFFQYYNINNMYVSSHVVSQLECEMYSINSRWCHSIKKSDCFNLLLINFFFLKKKIELFLSSIDKL